MITFMCRFDLERSVCRVQRLERQLAEALDHLHTAPPLPGDMTSNQQATVSPSIIVPVPSIPAAEDRDRGPHEEVLSVSCYLHVLYCVCVCVCVCVCTGWAALIRAGRDADSGRGEAEGDRGSH